LYKISKEQERNAIFIYVGLLAVAVFVIVFLGTQLVLSEYDKAYGYDFTKGPYSTIINVTTDAAEKTQGMAILNYIADVKQDICKTLSNSTEVSKCLNL